MLFFERALFSRRSFACSEEGAARKFKASHLTTVVQRKVLLEIKNITIGHGCSKEGAARKFKAKHLTTVGAARNSQT